MTKGAKNFMWKGGVAEYPNHYLMKKQRLIILMRNPKCEKCGKPATEIHHRNRNKADHRLRNLMASCHSCNLKLAKIYISKYRRLYGKNLKELGKEYNMCNTTIYKRIKKNIDFDSPKFITQRKCSLSKYRKLYGKTFKELLEIGMKKYRLPNWIARKKIKQQKYPFKLFLKIL